MTTVHGCSDDLIDFEGDIYGEVSHYSERPAFVNFSDGTRLAFTYTKAGLWKIAVKRQGSLFDQVDACEHEKDGRYWDVAHFKDGLEWAKFKGKNVK